MRSSVKIGFEVGFQDKIQRSGFGTRSGLSFETRVGVRCRAEDEVGFQGQGQVKGLGFEIGVGVGGFMTWVDVGFQDEG